MLLNHGISISMDGKGSWRDNVFVERLWRSVKYEEVYLKAYDSVSEARASLADYLAFYNQRRPHSSLDRARQTRLTSSGRHSLWRHEFSAARWMRLRPGYALPTSPPAPEHRKGSTPAAVHLSFAESCADDRIQLSKPLLLLRRGRSLGTEEFVRCHDRTGDARQLVGERDGDKSRRPVLQERLVQSASRSGLLRSQRKLAVAPRTRKRRRYGLPCFVIPPSISFPPQEFCRGTRPSHGARSRPERNMEGSGTCAAKAARINAPAPGTQSTAVSTPGTP